MTSSYARGRRGEQWLEAATGAKRVRHRPRFMKAADFAPLALPSGETIQLESKHGESVEPKRVRAAIDQARNYSPSCVPCAVFRNVGATDGIICLPLSDFCRLVGLDECADRDPQLALARAR